MAWMGFRFRRRIGPRGIKINISKKGISSVSVGGRGVTVNAPVGREGGIKYTLGVPGSGMSWEHQEKGGFSEEVGISSAEVQPHALNILLGLAVILVPIAIIGGCVAVLNASSEDARKREIATERMKRQSDWIALGELSVSSPRMEGGGLARVVFEVTNNSDRSICNLAVEIGFTAQNGGRQHRSDRLMSGVNCLLSSETRTMSVVLPNRKLAGAMIGSAPTVTLIMPSGGLSGDWSLNRSLNSALAD